MMGGIDVGSTPGTTLPYDLCQRFDYTGLVQTYTVPSGVTSIRVECHGTKGQYGTGPSIGGLGAMVRAVVPVVAGQVYNVYVAGGLSTSGAWPNGGQGVSANNLGAGGGAASYIVRNTEDLGIGITTNAKIVAAGGGGGSDAFFAAGPGGQGGFLSGGNGSGNSGSGATQTGPGVGSASDEAGDTDGQGHGGDGAFYGASARAEGGGGGGGWHGGAAGTIDASAGGGGSGWSAAGNTDLVYTDGTETATNGFVEICRQSPLLPPLPD